jgi:hypothetical protein
MTSTTIHHRPTPLLGAAIAVGAVAALAVGGVVVSHQHAAQPAAPSLQTPGISSPGSSGQGRYVPTTSGGRVMITPSGE